MLASTKGSNVSLWNAKECKCYLQLKKNDDPAIPTKIGEHCRVVMAENWASPMLSPHASDDEQQQVEQQVE